MPAKSPVRRRMLWQATGVLIAALLAAILAGPRIVDWQANKTYSGTAVGDLSAYERAVHRSLFIADLHADTLLWNRDIIARSGWGHLDLPRLLEANVALQVFSVVGKVTLATTRAVVNGENIRCQSADGLDATAALRMIQRRPPAQWFDTEEAVLAQADDLRLIAQQSKARRASDPRSPELMPIATVADLERLVRTRRAGEPIIGAVLAVEGTPWISGPDSAITEAVTRLVRAGFRMAGPIHRFDNALGQSSEGCGDGPALTSVGETYLREAERQGLIIDLAHASDGALLAAMRDRRLPVAVSHTGIRRLCQQRAGCRISRNLDDEAIRAIARNGGIVAIGYWTGAVGRGTSRIVDAFESALDVLDAPEFVAEMRAGGRHYAPLEHLALGSDFDGASLTPFDVSGLPGLTAALIRRGRDGLDAESLRLIAGVNACRMLAGRLPGGSPDAARRICDPLLSDAPKQ